MCRSIARLIFLIGYSSSYGERNNCSGGVRCMVIVRIKVQFTDYCD